MGTQFAGFIRHMNPLFCSVNACAEYLILSYGRGGCRKIPDIFNPLVDWTSSEWLVTNDSCTGPMMYSKRRKKCKADVGDPCTNHHDLDGHYEIFELMKQAAGLAYIDKATHFRLYGAMYGDQYGALDEEIERLGRWLGEQGNSASNTCKRHYLRNLPIGGLLAMAARHAAVPGNSYHCARETTLDIGDLDGIKEDQDFYPVIEHLMPGWFERARRAKLALLHNPVEPTDPISLSNAAFTRLLVASTVAWVQDAALLTAELPELFSKQPYTYLQDAEIANHWENIKHRVQEAEEQGKHVQHEVYLERQDLLQHIRSCTVASTNRIINEVPSRMCSLLEQSQQDEQQREVDYHLHELSRLTGATVARDVLPGLTTMATRESTQQETQPVWNIPYTLQSNDSLGYNIVSMVREWKEEVMPREAANKEWWEAGNTSQKKLREKRKLLYSCVQHRADQLRDDVEDVATTLQEAIVGNGGCWTDVETILRQWRNSDGQVDPWNTQTITETITKRKQQQEEKAKKRRTEKALAR